MPKPSATGHSTTNLKPPSATTKSTEDVPSKLSKPTVSTLPTRRQNLVRPSQLKTPSSVKSTPGSTSSSKNVEWGQASPVKQNDVIRRLASPKKTDMPPPPKPTRSTSLRQPPSSNSGTQTAPTGMPSPLKPTRSTSLRQPPNSSSRTVTASTDMPPPPKPTRSTSLRQPPSSNSGTLTAHRGHARHRSQVVVASPSGLAGKTSQSPSMTATARPRNQFTTYQQQFSPRKTTKPPTPTPSGDAAVDQTALIPSSWPEIAALQTELLQLSLLHTSWLRQNNERESDAQEQLRSTYNSVAEDYKAILDVEKESQRKLNGQALLYWLKNSHEHNGQQGFAEQVQLLSQVAQEVYDICDSRAGRYTLAILEFEKWLQEVEEIRAARFSSVAGHDPGIFIDPIDRQWKEEVKALGMKLDLASRQLQCLDILGYREVEALDQSALIRTVKALDEILSLMVDELRSIRKIESEIVKEETTRVSQLAHQLTGTPGRPRDIPTTAVPRTGLWRRSSLET
ncbi:hypothetical protein BJX61DRAFT_98464 [Aspergillus egyptiacus]|nr:hypothetical protein BJX61DRAFT_98464 [Aspergillus egyptiacus]